MTSQRQLEANRANAKRSTGPKSPQGKARSRRNSYKDGLRARILLSGEDEAEFNQLRARLLQEYDPQTTLEGELVDDLARIILLRKRAACFEAAILDARGEELIVSARRARSDPLIDLSILRASREEEEEEQDEKTPEAEWRLQVGTALLHDAANGDVLAKVDRHRAMLMNELMKTMKLLHFLQDKRARDQDRTLMIEETPATSDRGDNRKE